MNKLIFYCFSTLLYLKFVLLWSLVIAADYLLEFRFEFLWPFYLLIRSVYDSFKYQGLAFSLFFVIVAITSDMLCYFFIPVQWLFFAASTYVWVQYVWHTDKGKSFFQFKVKKMSNCFSVKPITVKKQ